MFKSFHTSIPPILLLLFCYYIHAEIINCDYTPIQVISVFDITLSNVAQFREQQTRLIDTLRHLDRVAKSRTLHYSLIAYHKLPVSLTTLNEPGSKSLQRIIDQIESLNPRYHLEKSPVIALQAAANQIAINVQGGVQSLVILTHSDGPTSDSSAEIVNVRSNLEALNATIFVFANDPISSNSLTVYTRVKERIFTNPSDLPQFYDSIDKTINACLDDTQPNGIPSHKAFGVRNFDVLPTKECTSNQVLMALVLDTSGSLQQTFEREKNLAIQLIDGLDNRAFGRQLQVSVIEFAADPSIIVSFNDHASKNTILNRLRSINFTGRITRIAKAVELGLKELMDNGLPGSERILALISDGNSLDYWHDVKKIGSDLRNSNLTVFVASTSSEINFDEMLLYSGNRQNIFLGTRDKLFPSTVGSLIHKCLNSPDSTKLTNTQKVSNLGNQTMNSTPQPDNTIESQFVLNEQFLPLQKPTPNKRKQVEERIPTLTSIQLVKEKVVEQIEVKTSVEKIEVKKPLEKVSTTTQQVKTRKPVPNDAKHPQTTTHLPQTTKPIKPIFTKIVGRKIDNTPKQFDNPPKQFDERPTRNEFSDLSAKEIIANTTEIDDNEFVEGSGQEVKVEDGNLIKLISTVQQNETHNEEKKLNCNFHLNFVIVNEEKTFEKQVKVITEIVERIPETLIPSQIRFSLVLISSTATHIELSTNITKMEFLNVIKNVNPIEVSSPQLKLSQIIQNIKSEQRSHSQLVNLLLFDKNSNPIQNGHLLEVFNSRLLPKTSLILGSIPLNSTNSFNTQEFIQQAIDTIRPCISDSVEKKFHAFVEARRKVHTTTTESLSTTTTESIITTTLKNDVCDDPIDLFVVLSIVSKTQSQFEFKTQLLTNIIRQLSVAEFKQRIRISLTTYSYEEAQLLIPLRSSLSKDDTLLVISQLKFDNLSKSNEYNSSLVSGIKTSLSDVLPAKRSIARLVGLLIVDETPTDQSEAIFDVYQSLKTSHSDVNILGVGDGLDRGVLQQYVGNDSIYSQFNNEIFNEARNSWFGCRNKSKLVTQMNVDDDLHRDVFDEKDLSKIFRRSDNTINENISENISEPSSLQLESCKDIDLILVVDTSTSVETAFNKQIEFANKLIEHLPDSELQDRIQVGVISFFVDAKIELPLGSLHQKVEITNTLSSIKHNGGSTFIANGMKLAIELIGKRSRKNARFMIVLISDGNSQDEWQTVLGTSAKLHLLNAEVFALTASNDYFLRELEIYANKHVYTSSQFETFLKDADSSIFDGCLKHSGILREQLSTKPSISTVSSTKPSISTTTPPHTFDISRNKDGKVEFAARDESLSVRNRSTIKDSEECKVAKIDLIIILDASTSRESVFEHQRELALSLIERLPISRGDTHVAIGLNSFVHVPTLRLNLGLGRDRTMVRKAIEEIEFVGGSTLTSQAVDLAIKDLEKGRREDAIQIIVLMNDGMSQDAWETVQSTSQRLSNTNAELFGVALGDNVDLRELQLYIKRKERIYRDGSSETERFLQDIVALVRNDTTGNCPLFFKDVEEEPTTDLPSHQMEELCHKPNFDIVVLFDNSDSTEKMSDPKLNSNRYLLLDVLGSLPLGAQVHVTVFSFAQTAHLEFDLTSESEKDVLFEKVEAIQPKKGKPSYSEAINEALSYYKRNHRSNARGLLLIVGNGQNATDSKDEQKLAADQIQKTTGLLCQAVDSGKKVNIITLSAYTGSTSNVFNYDRNAEFAKNILKFATAVNEGCSQESSTTQSTFKNHKNTQPLRDIAVSDSQLQFNSEKRIKRPTLKFNNEFTTPKPTTIRSSAKLSEVPTTLKESTKTPLKSTETPLKVTETQASKTSTTTTTVNKVKQLDKASKSKVKLENKLTNITSNCLIDLILIIDTSGSVNETLEHTKRIASNLLEKLDIGTNVHVSLIKFASKARTLHSFNDPQSKDLILQKLNEIVLSLGTTSIHLGLLQGISEYTSVRGARLDTAQPLAVIFTDGFGQKDMSLEAQLLQEIAPLYAIGINHEFPVNRKGLELITGDAKRVFTDSNINDFYELLKKLSRC